MLVVPVLGIECQDETPYWDVPCTAVTPVITTCANYTAEILDVGNATSNNTASMLAVGDGTYNITFNRSVIGTYSIVTICNNWSATVAVVDGFEGEPGLNLWVVLFTIFGILLFFGVLWRNHTFLFSGGSLMLLAGLWVFREGITSYTVNNWWVYPLAWIFTGIGIIMTVGAGYDYLEEMAGGEF